MLGSVAQHADAAQPRPLIDRRDVLRREAFMGDGDVDHHDILALIKRSIHAAFDDAVAADHGDDFVILDQFGGDLRGNVWSPLIVGHDVFDRAAVDAAIGIHALEIGVRRFGRRAEIIRPGDPIDRSDRDRLARRRLAVVQAAARLG